jgi:hypothetical protein
MKKVIKVSKGIIKGSQKNQMELTFSNILTDFVQATLG